MGDEEDSLMLIVPCLPSSLVYTGQAKEFIEAVPKVTANALVDAGLNPAKVHLILKAQDKAAQQKNDRLAKFLNNYVDQDLLKWQC